jgi:hypothetical protein
VLIADTETGPGVFETALAYTDSGRMADNAILFKFVAKSVGMKYGITPTFMAKPYSDVRLFLLFHIETLCGRKEEADNRCQGLRVIFTFLYVINPDEIFSQFPRRRRKRVEGKGLLLKIPSI